MNDKKAHYYGDLVRKFFLAAAIFMLVMLPFMNRFLEVPLYISIVIAIGISVFAGLTNPIQKWVAILDFVIAVTGASVAEYHAVIGYTTYSMVHRSFWANQILAVIFLVALYYSTKTVRGMIVK